MTKRTYLIILGIGIALRLLLIGKAELWYDENFTLVIARLPFLRMLSATMGDVHPPLYYMLIWPLAQIPHLAPWMIRLPSALVSIASLSLYPRLMRELRVPPSVQLIAFGMLAVLPFQLTYAQEARMYALLEFFVLLGALAILEGRAWLLTVAVTGMLYTANYGTFYVAALAVVLLIVIFQQSERHRETMSELRAAASDIGLAAMKQIDPLDESMRRDLRVKWNLLALGLVLGIWLWLPWLPTMLRQADFISGNYWIFDTSPGGISYVIFKLFWSLSLATAAGNVTGMLLTFGLIIAGAWYLLTHRPHSWLIIAALAFAPIVMAVIVSLTFQPVILDRPLIGVTPFLYLACAYPLGMLTTLRGRLYAACFIGPVLTMGLLGFYIFTPDQKTRQATGSEQEALAYITAHWQPGDLILHGSALGYINMAPYTDLPQYAIVNCSLKFPGSISPETTAAIGVQVRTVETLPPHKRIWLTGVESPMLPACQLNALQYLVAGRKPTLVMSESKFLFSAVWLLEAQ